MRQGILSALVPPIFIFLAGLDVPGLAANPLDATVTLNTATSLTVTEASVNFGTIAGFTSGIQTPIALHLNAKCNKKNGYAVTVKATGFTSADGDASTFPLSDLEYSYDQGINYRAMTASDQNVRTATANTSGSGDNFTVPIRLNLLGSEAAGTYTTTIVFTIAAN